MAFENLKSTGITYLLGKLKTVFLQIKDAVKSVNGELPDETGDITINSVPYAANLESDTSHRNTGAFIQRTSGGDSSVINGDAWLMNLKGNNDHSGYVAEDITWNMTVIGDDDHITATFNRDTFVNYVANSGTITLAFSTAWSADPTLYGFTITGTPEAGDTITVVYVKEERGTITVANPQSYVSTGWNLFDLQNGYAKVVKYAFGYRIEGPYSTVKFATTPSGTQSSISVSSGNFDIPSDGYVIVTGGTSETAIYATWEDWTDGYSGEFEAYNASTIDLTNVMSEYFPYGLLKAGTTVDEIDLNLGQAISRVERLSYSAANLATAQNSGREFEYDENYIYLARASAETASISVNGSYIVNDHGIEYFTTTTLEVNAEVLYGNNLKNKLERDVLTISQQTLTSSEQSQVRTNIGAASSADLATKANVAGQVFTGNVSISKAIGSESRFLISNGTGLETKLIIASTGRQHGVYSSGYINSNDEYNAAGRYLVSRNEYGNTVIGVPQISISTNASKTIGVVNGTRAMIFSISSGNTSMDIFHVYCTNTGSIVCKSALSASNITVTTGTNSLTFAAGASSGIILFPIVFSGGFTI